MLTSKLQASQTHIRERWYPHFSWLLNDSAPWSPLPVDLADATVALVSTCGLYEMDSQVPFDAWNDLGDPSFRELPTDSPAERWRIAHAHYKHDHVAPDPAVSLPIQLFRQLAGDGKVGRLHPLTYSFMGYLPEPRQLIHDTAPQVARRLATAGVHAAFLTPC